jgi:hypothetical protein
MGGCASNHANSVGIYVFDARGVAKRFRHAAIFGALDSLNPGRQCASITITTHYLTRSASGVLGLRLISTMLPKNCRSHNRFQNALTTAGNR